MSDPVEARVIQKFRERIYQGALDDINVTYRISGGMPTDWRVDEQLRISNQGISATQVIPQTQFRQEAASTFDEAERRELFQLIAQGIDSLVLRSQARFLPDSAVGSITIEIGGEQVTLFFLVDAEDRQSQDKPIAPAMVQAVNMFSQFSKRLRRKEGS